MFLQKRKTNKNLTQFSYPQDPWNPWDWYIFLHLVDGSCGLLQLELKSSQKLLMRIEGSHRQLPSSFLSHNHAQGFFHTLVFVCSRYIG